MASSSPHLTNIPEAVRIAASTDPSIDPGLKQQAIDYLNKVRELCEETWQVRTRTCTRIYAYISFFSGQSQSQSQRSSTLPFPLQEYAERMYADGKQDCLALYLQGAGAPGPSSTGRDGKEKLSTDLRMYCQQVVDVVLTQK